MRFSSAHIKRNSSNFFFCTQERDFFSFLIYVYWEAQSSFMFFSLSFFFFFFLLLFYFLERITLSSFILPTLSPSLSSSSPTTEYIHSTEDFKSEDSLYGENKKKRKKKNKTQQQRPTIKNRLPHRHIPFPSRLAISLFPSQHTLYQI